MFARLPAAFLAALLAACGSATSETSQPVAPPAGPIAPEYTTVQAGRGQAVFTNVCSTCHGRNEFTGQIFALTWRAEPLFALFEHVSTNMPQDRPGSLTPQQYVDVVSYILQLNGIPAGARELTSDPALLARIDW